MKLTRGARVAFRQLAIVFLLLGLLLAAASARAATVYYSAGPPTYSFSGVCVTCGGVSTGISTPVGGVKTTAAVTLPLGGKYTLRYQLADSKGVALSGTSPGTAGFRAGVLLSNGNSVLNASSLGTVTIRTYLSSAPTVVQDQQVVTATAVQAGLLAGAGNPEQFELLTTSTKDFNIVEVEFGSALSLAATINAHYAYAVGPNDAAPITGITSNSGAAGSVGTYSTDGSCADKVLNPAQAVDFDRTNYASFASVASLFCASQLTVGLGATAPSTFKAGFVIGQNNTLADISVLGHLTLKTYKNGVLQETATGASLLGLSVLPDGKSLVSFQATKEFDAVSIERADAASLLDNLQLYYGVGLASTTPPQVISSFPSTDKATHYTTSQSGICVSCSVANPTNATGDPSAAATINIGLGVANKVGLTLDLNGRGQAGNRAGMVLGSSSLLDVDALSRMTLVTTDSAGNVLETATGSSLLSIGVLPDGRRTVSFNTTKRFAKVGIQMSGLANAVSNTDVYYAFTDNSNGNLRIVNPTGPLPVSLLSFGVRRGASGAAILSWATASEINSARFVVERSANPAEGFVAVGSVAAAGSSGTLRTYSLQDTDVASLAGTQYYRLRQVDLDGKAHLSAVVVLAAGPARAGFSLYPNPATAATQQVTLSGADLAAGYSVSLYSGLGQLLRSQVVGSEGQVTQVALPTGGLASGIYHVVVRNAGSQVVSSQRLLVAGQ